MMIKGYYSLREAVCRQFMELRKNLYSNNMYIYILSTHQRHLGKCC